MPRAPFTDVFTLRPYGTPEVQNPNDKTTNPHDCCNARCRLCSTINVVNSLNDGWSSLDTSNRASRSKPCKIVPQDAALEKLADGFAWAEGPVWNRAGGFLLFSDVPNNAIIKWKAGDGAKVFLMPSGYSGKEPFSGREPGSNGLTFDSEGRLVFCQHGDRRISRLEKDGSRTTLVDNYQGKRLNSPNDLVFKSNGDLYFTDPPFGLPKSFDDSKKELPFQGVYRLSRDGKLTLLTTEVKAPNGIASLPTRRSCTSLTQLVLSGSSLR